ncbi:hypothetical protein LY90DRAFT_517518 [Neocallimastix californiae]|uniref:BAG domain-containing protein n=1 Tax=Neocallimastix californiae TaxID=1754190 RepID=A0A1Y2A5V1_9FUNG|nr:hypothetical protein LY90DRAFT_517518 [Neocallimastix californiae]|eukprot:ORY17886.1 hypothetical protein LY90DRAFT_517518 [Neocallimastix californiae]
MKNISEPLSYNGVGNNSQINYQDNYYNQKLYFNNNDNKNGTPIYYSNLNSFYDFRSLNEKDIYSFLLKKKNKNHYNSNNLDTEKITIKKNNENQRKKIYDRNQRKREYYGEESINNPNIYNKIPSKLREFIRKQPSNFLDKCSIEISQILYPLIEEYENKVKYYHENGSCDIDLEILYRKITENIMNKIILIDKIESCNKEIVEKRKTMIDTFLKLIEKVDKKKSEFYIMPNV